MSGIVPWDDGYRVVEPASNQDALSSAQMHGFPGDRGGLIDLFNEMERNARADGRPWRYKACQSLAGTIGIAIRAYADKADSHGFEPRRLEKELIRAQKLARDLRRILLMKEGQERYAPVLERGYPRSEIEHPFGPDIGKNTFLNLLSEIAENGPLTEIEATKFGISDKSLVVQHRNELQRPLREFLPDELVRKRDAHVQRLARNSVEGQGLVAELNALWTDYAAPKARDEIRHQLMAYSIDGLASVLGSEVRQSLVEGRNRPWTLLKSLVFQIVEFVGSYRGAPAFVPGQDSSAFNHALEFAGRLSRADELQARLARLEVQYWTSVFSEDEPASPIDE